MAQYDEDMLFLLLPLRFDGDRGFIWEGDGCYLGTTWKYLGPYWDHLGVILGERGGDLGPIWGLNIEASKHTYVVEGNAGMFGVTRRVASMSIQASFPGPVQFIQT